MFYLIMSRIIVVIAITLNSGKNKIIPFSFPFTEGPGQETNEPQE